MNKNVYLKITPHSFTKKNSPLREIDHINKDQLILAHII